MDDLCGKVSRALEDGATGLEDGVTVPEAFTLLFRLLSGHFDHAGSGAGYKKLYTFGEPNGTTFCEFSEEVRVVVSEATGTLLVLAPWAEIVLELV